MPRFGSRQSMAALVAAGVISGSAGIRTISTVSTRDSPALCAPEIVSETCAKLAGAPDSTVQRTDIAQVLSAQDEEVAHAWQAILGDGAPPSTSCSHLCEATLAFLGQTTELPPSSDVGCFYLGGALKCDVDLRPETVKHLVDPAAEKAMRHTNSAAGGARGGPGVAATWTSGDRAPPPPEPVHYDAHGLGLRIAGLFRVYPPTEAKKDAAGSSSLLQATAEEWEEAAARTNVQARAYLETAIKEFKQENTKMQLEQWFGPGASEDDESRAEVQRILNSVQSILSNIVYAFPGQHCNDITVAYVLPKAGGVVKEKCDGVLPGEGENCVMNSEDKYVYYLCPLYMTEPLSSQIGTQLHEASHHGSAYTDDVCMNEFYHGRESVEYMVVPVNMMYGGKGRIGDEVMVPYPDEDIERFRHHAELPYVQAQIHSISEGDAAEAVVKIFQKDLDDACISEESQKAFDVKFCLDLARLSTMKALRNADNFRYFVEHVVSSESKEEVCSKNLDFCVGARVVYSGPQILAGDGGEGEEVAVAPGAQGIVQYPHFDVGEEVRYWDAETSDWKLGKVTGTVPLRVDGYIEEQVRPKEGQPELVAVRFGDRHFAEKVNAKDLTLSR